MIRIAKRVADKSTFGRARLGAVITKNGRVLSTGFNKIGFTKHLKHKNAYSCTIHAEEAAIIALLGRGRQDILVGSTMYLSRVLRDGTSGMAKPCKNCQDLIRAVGMKRVMYTTDAGVEEWKP